MVWGAARNKRVGIAGINPWFGVLPEINVWGLPELIHGLGCCQK